MESPQDFFDDAFARTLIEAHSQENPYPKFQIDSFETFVEQQLPKIVKEQCEVTYDSEVAGERHVVTMGKLTLTKPTWKEDVDGQVHAVNPTQCRQRNITYQSTVFVDVVHKRYSIVPEEGVGETKGEPIESGDPTYTLLETRSYREVPLFELPVMVGSKYCRISENPLTASECPHDLGGYFIIKGVERVIQISEERRHNNDYLTKSNATKFSFGMEVRSRHESKFRSSSTLYANITVRRGGTPSEIIIILPFLGGLEIPVNMLFRLLGFEDHDLISSCILGASPHDSPLYPALQRVLQQHTSNTMTVDQIYEWIGTHAQAAQSQKQKQTLNSVAKRKKHVVHLLASELLPQHGCDNTPDVMLKKFTHLGIITRRLLQVDHDFATTGKSDEIDDRDDYATKMLYLSGTMLANLLRQLFRRFTKNISNYLHNTLSKPGPYMNLDICKAIDTHHLTSTIGTAFRGNWSAHRQGSHSAATQILMRTNHVATHSQIRRVTTPMCKEGKATDVRHLHLSAWRVMCPSETPEGESCGLVKNLTNFADVRRQTSVERVFFVLQNYVDVEPLTADTVGIPVENLVFVNGRMMGFTMDPEEMAERVRAARRQWIIPPDASVYATRYGVRVDCDSGVCISPVFVAGEIHRVPEIYENCMNHPELNLWACLHEGGVIEMLDKNEERVMRVASTATDFFENPGAYTHMEVVPSGILGLCASLIPFSNHNQAPRNTYQSAMGKQAVAQAVVVADERFDTQMNIPYYGQKAICETAYAQVNNCDELPVGLNCIVAIMAHTGYNQEDSLLISKRFIDLGGFRSTHYKNESTEEKSSGSDRERICNPSTVHGCTGLQNADYSKLEDDGIVGVGTCVVAGDVIIGKTSTTEIPDGSKETQIRCRSVVLHGGGDFVVDKVMLTTNKDGNTTCTVRLRDTRIPMVADKACLTPDHDVLTRNRGWVPVSDVVLSDEVACLDPVSKELAYMNPHSLYAYDYDDEMYHVASQQLDLVVTPDHRMFVKADNDFELLEASRLRGRLMRYKKDAVIPEGDYQMILPAFGDYPDKVLDMDLWLDYFGWWMADGWVSKGTNSVAICKIKEPQRTEIFNLATALGYRPYLHGDNVLITDAQLAAYLRPLSVGAINKSLPDWVWNLSSGQARQLMEGMGRGDGTVTSSGGLNYFTSSTQLADDVQHLCLRCGWSANKVLRGVAGIQNADCWELVIVKTKNTPTVNHSNAHKQNTQIEEMVHYQGPVYCLGVPTEVFYVRRNGKPVWTGNSSRHGQKGTIGLVVAAEDLPFTAEGITPDLIMSPHAIPSRMTIAHMIEALASKTGLMLGKRVDATPFRGGSENTIEALGDHLHACGYQRHGYERLYNGKTGRLMDAQIYMGPIYYQKLKHMVRDKHHARTTGRTTMITRQPTEGRSQGGGQRFGEMERDCLITHGSAATLQERMSSDKFNVPICRQCGLMAEPAHDQSFGVTVKGQKAHCRNCGGDDVVTAQTPYAYKVLMQEMEALHINVRHSFD